MSLLSKKLNQLDHTVPIYSPRTTYKNIRQNDENLLSDLTLNFDPFTINVLKNEFIMRKGSMDLQEFILVVKEHLLSWQTEIPNRDLKLIRCLFNLFEEIDLNGNHSLEWDEFTNYVIQKATVLNNIKSKADEIKQYTKSPIQPIFKAENVQSRQFNSALSKIIYIEHLNRLAMFEEGTAIVRFMNPETGEFDQKCIHVIPQPNIVKTSNVKQVEDGSLHIQKKEHEIQRKTMILDILYIPDQKYQILLTSTNDGLVRGWKLTNNGWVVSMQPDNDQEPIEHDFQKESYCLAWDNLNEILYCGMNDGMINIWNFKTDTESALDQQDSHTSVIMDMIAMPKLQFMASCSLDNKVILWDTIKNQQKRVYREHIRGIVSLAFNESLILLFSAGLDHEICVWNPYIDNIVYQITGHSSPLLGVKVIDGTTQVVSCDNEGNVRITDIKKFTNVQIFSVQTSDEKHKFNPQHFSFFPKPLRLAFCGRSVQIFEYDKNYNPNFVDDAVAICCIFVPSQLAFYTPAGSKLKIWNALTGDIKKIVADLVPGEITVFVMDKLQKRIILGDSQGNVALYNVYNGAKIKSLPKHELEVSHIIHIHEPQKETEKPMFLTCGTELMIFLVLDNDFGENQILKQIDLKQSEIQITSLQFEPQHQYIVFGTDTGVTSFYESQTVKLIGTYNELSNTEEITSINILPYYLEIPNKDGSEKSAQEKEKDQFPFIMTTCSSGKVNFIALPPLLNKFTKTLYFTVKDPVNKQQPLSILNSVFCAKTFRLFIIDDKGYLRCYNIEDIIQELRHIAQSTEKRSSLFKPIQYKNDEFEPLFCEKAHNQIIKSVEYSFEENILMTTAFDKKVKIWSAETGMHIDSFQQNYDKKEPKPIAFQRSGTDQIYDPSLEQRIDWNYVNMKNQQQNGVNPVGGISALSVNSSTLSKSNSRETRISKLGFGQDQDQHFQQNKNDDEKNIFANFNPNQSPDEEFNPYYFINKIDTSKLKYLKSNPEWKLNIDFKQYYEQFQNDIKEQMEKAQQRETVKTDEFEQPGFMSKSKLKNFQIAETMKRFNVDNKPILQEHKNLSEQREDNDKEEMHLKIEEGIQRIQQIRKPGTEDVIQKVKSMSSIPTLPSIQQQQFNPQVFEDLHRKELQGQLIFQSSFNVRLSKEQVDAAYQLASALANVDKDDYRSLKFLDLKVKEPQQGRIKNAESRSSASLI